MVSRPTRRSAKKVGSYKEPTISDIPMADEDDDDPESNLDSSSISNHNDDSDSSVEIQLSSTRKRKRAETSQDSDENDVEKEDVKQSDSSQKDYNEDDDSVQEIIPKRRKKGRPKGSSGAKARNDSSLEDLTCPSCGKVFKNHLGLAYHVKHKVCNKNTSTKLIGTAPMPKLQSGDCFVTDFGVVKVVKDERVGDDFGKTLVSPNVKKQSITFTRQKERIRRRIHKSFLYHAKLGRKRRQRIHNLYLQRKDGSISAKDFASEIFNNYIPGISENQALAGLFQLEQNNLVPAPVFPEDPLQPKDSYPERIVECVLIKDERKRITDKDDEFYDSDDINQLGKASSIIANSQKVKQHENSSEASGTDEIHESGMKVYIRRNLLTVPYTKQLPFYACSDCGKSYNIRSVCKAHIDEKKCLEQLETAKDAREKLLEEIEESLKLQETQIAMSAPRYNAPHNPGKKKGKDTRKRKRKKSLVYPSWLVFYADKSPLYPEVSPLFCGSLQSLQNCI